MGRRRMTTGLVIAAGLLIGIPLVAALVGSLLPRDHVARMRLELRATPSEVWQLISDFRGTAEWRPDVRAVDPLPASDGRIRFLETTRQGQTPFEVVTQEPGLKQVVRVVDEGLPFGGTWTWELVPAGRGTRLTLTEAGFIRNPIFRLMGRLFFKPSATIQSYLRALARRLGEAAEPVQAG